MPSDKKSSLSFLVLLKAVQFLNIPCSLRLLNCVLICFIVFIFLAHQYGMVFRPQENKASIGAIWSGISTKRVSMLRYQFLNSIKGDSIYWNGMMLLRCVNKVLAFKITLEIGGGILRPLLIRLQNVITDPLIVSGTPDFLVIFHNHTNDKYQSWILLFTFHLYSYLVPELIFQLKITYLPSN